MTNYNDGNWHGWNGGECPVHPETLIEARYETSANSAEFDAAQIKAKDRAPGCWQHRAGFNGIIAFRVVKEHREPVEAWFVNTSAGWFEGTQSTPGARLFREVIA